MSETICECLCSAAAVLNLSVDWLDSHACLQYGLDGLRAVYDCITGKPRKLLRSQRCAGSPELHSAAVLASRSFVNPVTHWSVSDTSP